MNKELILLMRSKAVLESGLNQIKSSQCAVDAQRVTSDTYIKLITTLFQSATTERKAELRDQLNAALYEGNDSEMTFELPNKMKKRDEKAMQKKSRIDSRSDSGKSGKEASERETITEHFRQRKSPSPAQYSERYLLHSARKQQEAGGHSKPTEAARTNTPMNTLKAGRSGNTAQSGPHSCTTR